MTPPRQLLDAASRTISEVRAAVARPASAFRTAYEVTNSVISNTERLDALDASLAPLLSIEAHQVEARSLLGDSVALRAQWAAKPKEYEAAAAATDKPDWLKQLQEEDAEEEAASGSRKGAAAKPRGKKKGGGAKERDEKRSGSPGGGVAVDGAPERGSSLTFLLGGGSSALAVPSPASSSKPHGSSTTAKVTAPVPLHSVTTKEVALDVALPPSLSESSACDIIPEAGTALVTATFENRATMPLFTSKTGAASIAERKDLSKKAKAAAARHGAGTSSPPPPMECEVQLTMFRAVFRTLLHAGAAIGAAKASRLKSIFGGTRLDAAEAARLLPSVVAVRKEKKPEKAGGAARAAPLSSTGAVGSTARDDDEEDRAASSGGSSSGDDDDQGEELPAAAGDVGRSLEAGTDAPPTAEHGDDDDDQVDVPVHPEGADGDDAEDELRSLSAQLVREYSEGGLSSDDSPSGMGPAVPSFSLIAREAAEGGSVSLRLAAGNPALALLRVVTQAPWVVIMCHGGYFAGAVWVDGVAVVHKALHRYIVRRGQGGKQSAQENIMSSAGSQIRRAQEVKFRSDVREVLELWRPLIDRAWFIAFVAPGPDNKKIITDWSDAPGSSGMAARSSPVLIGQDARVFPVPLTTHRPTFTEATRAFVAMSHCVIRQQVFPEK